MAAAAFLPQKHLLWAFGERITAQLIKDRKQDTSGWAHGREALPVPLVESGKVFTKRCMKWKRRSEFLAVTCMWPCILSLSHVKLEEKLCWGRARAQHRRWSCKGDDNIPSFESSTGLKHTYSYGLSIPSDVLGTCNYLGRYHVHQLHFGGLQNQDNWGLL